MTNEIEYFDVYDKNKMKTGEKLPRRSSFLKENQYELIVLAIIERPDGRFLITRRAMDKKWAAGSWEVPGGGVKAGETSREGINREVAEETGLDVSRVPGRVIYTYSNTDLARGDNYFVDIYHFHMDFTLGDVHLQRSESIDARLASFDEIGKLNEAGKYLHYERICQALEAEGYEPKRG